MYSMKLQNKWRNIADVRFIYNTQIEFFTEQSQIFSWSEFSFSWSACKQAGSLFNLDDHYTSILSCVQTELKNSRSRNGEMKRVPFDKFPCYD